MSDNSHLCLLGLIFLSLLLTGVSGVDDVHVFISSGEDVRLPCNNALQDCTSTTWNHYSYSAAVELIKLGLKNKDSERHERHERLSLGSDCSLNIRNISTEDHGSYICQQWTGEGGPRLRPDAGVYLHVLHVSSSHTEISAGLSVTLFCRLYSYPQVSCDDWIRSERIDLFWVNQTGVKSDSRYQISSSSYPCIISLTTTLLNEDDNREWRCEVTQRDQVKTSVTYTVKSSAQADSTTTVNLVTKSTPTTAVISVHSTDFPTAAGTTTPVNVTMIVVGTSFILLLLALILWMMIRKKRSAVRRATDDSVEPSSRAGSNSLFCEPQVNLESLHSSPESRRTSPCRDEQTDDVTYTEVTAVSKNRAKKNKVCCDDKVTYASIGGAKAGDQEDCSQLYASVNKNHHKSGK
ncbi:uncharacterized protein LOC127956263 isoform X1 [Carassius gibelio]|uniref:uncharacterized protein LOC127956263 isoform X1 n=1 Tax=Carassius gibelio TaxID=101364 RepID=UPI00227866B5|nr:uncharacterized protein LOC127956263 isoform X1 [Carassius gibelio]